MNKTIKLAKKEKTFFGVNEVGGNKVRFNIVNVSDEDGEYNVIVIRQDKVDGGREVVMVDERTFKMAFAEYLKEVKNNGLL